MTQPAIAKGEDTPSSVRQPASRSRIKSRHSNLVWSMLILILLPLTLIVAYLYVLAQDQYASCTGFTIRQEETGSASDLMGGLAQVFASAAPGNADLLFEYVQSQELVEQIDDRFDLMAHYTQHWPLDPVYSLWPSATIEDLVWFWGRLIKITYDKASGLIMIEVRAGDPESAREIGRLIVAESEEMINRLNETARRDTTRNAEADLEAALQRLRTAREAVAEFRARTQIVDPVADI